MASISLTTWNQEVYEPSDDTFALVDALEQELPAIIAACGHVPRTVLEIGCGSGFVVCSAALALRAAAPRAARLVAAVDVSEHALAAAAETLRAHGEGGAELLRCDLTGPLERRLAGGVDLLLFNPPYVPTPDEEVSRGGIARAWAGGHRGRRVIDRVLPALPALLSPGGSCLMVTVQENDPGEIIAMLEPRGVVGRVVLTRGADEESLAILRLTREKEGGTEAAAAAAAAGATGAAAGATGAAAGAAAVSG